MAEIRYIGKNGQPPKPRKLTAEQKEREASSARLDAAKAREREAIANIREMELARKRRELTPNKVFQRMNAYAFTCFKEHYRGGPTTLVRLVERVLRGKHDLDNADKHALRMEIDAWMRQVAYRAGSQPPSGPCRVPQRGGGMNLIPIDKLVEIWARVHEEALDLIVVARGLRNTSTPTPRHSRITRSSTTKKKSDDTRAPDV